MDGRAYDRSPLNISAMLLTEAQTDIKIKVKDGILSGLPFTAIKEPIVKIIMKTLSKIRSPTLKKDARRSLSEFAERVYKQFRAEIRMPPALISAVAFLMKDIPIKRE